MKANRKLLFAVAAVFGILFGGCSNQDILTIADISYNKKPDDCVVYVKENGVYVPFIVLLDNYCGNALLLRQKVLNNALPFNTYSAYYENSEIDRFLNGEYYLSLEPHPRICQSEIEITDEAALGISGDTTTNINRKVFLLSCTEVGINSPVNIAKEGKLLPYFEMSENRIAYMDAEACSWWLRTPNTYYVSCAYGISADGMIGFGNAYDNNGIRPAFCVDAATEIIVSDDLICGQSVYVLP